MFLANVPLDNPGLMADMVVDQRPVRVWVSYAHESEHHKDQVLAFCELLRRNNIDADLDQWNTSRRQDWYLWLLAEIRSADYVIVVASSAYKRAGDGDAAPGDHRGVQSEAALLRELLHGDRATWLPRLLPVVFPELSVDDIPLFLQPRTADHYPITEFTTAGAENLLRLLTGQPSVVRPPLGATPFLPPRSLTYPSDHHRPPADGSRTPTWVGRGIWGYQAADCKVTVWPRASS
jgi:hypothetical protein